MPDPLERCCARCAFWETDDPEHAVVAPCLLRNIGRPEFWQGCRDFLDREKAKAEQMTQQSQTRPVVMP